MAVRANISKGYIWRPGLIGAAALIFSGWFFYDGLVKYPMQQRMAGEYAKVYQEHTDPIEADRAWDQLATANNWPTSKPTPRTDTDIRTQMILGGITGPVGLYFLATFLLSLGKWIEADEQGVRTKSGQATDYASIKSIDKSRWQSKGIAVVQYESNSQSGRITLDDWKFEREPIKRILEAIEERMPGGGPKDEHGDGAAEEETSSA